MSWGFYKKGEKDNPNISDKEEEKENHQDDENTIRDQVIDNPSYKIKMEWWFHLRKGHKKYCSEIWHG